ncbi:Imm1 family immunity protein [Kitasatospora sp. NPDC090091]|uniref:Imm1 family immunity protein n=1 Tax=Kitasatospora sp. NPDC090091 TaxID=3364081 RepID=UPI00381D5F36
MILEISMAGITKYPANWGETEEMISEAISSISPEEVAAGQYGVGSQVWFSLIEPQAEHPCAYLSVAANETTGFGAITWWTDNLPPRVGGIYDYVWISDNPTPSEIDAQLVSDPHYPLYHDPASAIPLAQVRGVIEEFCSSGTGERPESISWVTGEINGQRHDRPDFDI